MREVIVARIAFLKEHGLNQFGNHGATRYGLTVDEIQFLEGLLEIMDKEVKAEAKFSEVNTEVGPIFPEK